MMTQFICLANSKKYSERCIAGVMVNKKKGGEYLLVKENDKPKWIRPVTSEDHGQVPSELVKDINLLDVVEIDVVEAVPNGYQSENVLFAGDSLKVIGKIESSSRNLDLLCDHNQINLFGNRGKAVHEDMIDTVTKSLTLIKVNNTETYKRTEYGKEQLRLKFPFNSSDYDLPITDIKFIDYCKSIEKQQDLKHILLKDTFITISLGVKHETFHYKLVAGVIH